MNSFEGETKNDQTPTMDQPLLPSIKSANSNVLPPLLTYNL